ncbi:phage tail protein [Pigmentiphaga sp. CHJ604]|uniref:phage tail protein n=1 Tax=Pigmentiphaga sp. CHJ604 TaxID=3081984 RepID=UPI0030CEF20D
MKKPASLRKHLTGAVPELKREPDKLQVFIDSGKIVSAGTKSLSFEYRFTLHLLLTDYQGSADAIMVPILAWLKIHQPELALNANEREKAFRFEVDILNHETCDIAIDLDLTERVAVTQTTGAGGRVRLQAEHVAEPLPAPAYGTPGFDLYDGDDKLAEWTVAPEIK